MDTQTTDIELIQRITNRDSKALESLYDRYSPVLYTLVKRIVADKEKAEEILADMPDEFVGGVVQPFGDARIEGDLPHQDEERYDCEAV